MAEAFPSFQLGGPLPTGLTALEASAGTGKTYALSALAVRYVAERGVPASGLCIVSFTEAATAELRGRIRRRLVEAAGHLEAGASGSDDPVLAAVADTRGVEVEHARRLANLRAAIADFDAATIATIHGFCSRVLAGAGTMATDSRLTSGDADVEEVVNDLFLARFGRDATTTISAGRLVTALRARLSMPDAEVWRPHADPERATRGRELELRETSRLAADLLDECYERVVNGRLEQRRRTFDGLLTETRDLLRSTPGPAMVAALRNRYQVVLIDEFQDTDRVQWDIFRMAFVEGPSAEPVTVVLVGDPKQAIYRFRAAEVSAYLDARGRARSVASLDTNWRSDGPLLGALERLFTGFEFGTSDVMFQPVAPSPGHEVAAIHGAGAAALELRCLPVDGEPRAVPQARRMVRRDVVTVVAELLAGDVTIDDGAGLPRQLRARDIAILTRSNANATELALDLGTAGIPAATAASNSVLDSAAARHWEVLLRALERPNSGTAARAAALGWFIGWSPERVVALDDGGLAELHELLRDWSTTLARQGLPELVSRSRAHGLHRRLLAEQGGERNLTDLDHVAELLQTATGGRLAGASALLQVMADVVDGRGDEAIAPEELARRIDRDDDAVQVLTVHKAKGLEFPVVLCPFLWTPAPTGRGIPHAHDGVRRRLDTSWVAAAGDVKWTKELRDLSRAENQGESRRLLYVALTRAKHRCIVWWSPLAKGSSQLSDVLTHALGLDGPPPSSSALVPLRDSTSTIAVVEVDDGRQRPPRRTPAQLDGADELTVDTADRRLDRAWRIWSFSALKSAAELRSWGEQLVELPGTGYIPPVGGSDEPALDDVEPDAATAAATALANAPGGTSFGTLVHGIFEQVDFAHESLHDHVRDTCAEALRFRPARITADHLADGLVAAIEAPLGGPLGSTRLRDITPADRLDELLFDLPLGRLRADRIGAVLVEHLAPDDPLRSWAADLAHHGFDLDVTGMLTGSIDLVARTPAAAGGPSRYWVADYKTNQLGLGSGYAGADLLDAMVHHEYPLQAVLYLVALHRYLRWRVPGYRPGVHLVGAAYLFVRGMDPDRPADRARGVFWWQPAAAAIVAVDQLLARGEAA